MSLLDSQRLSGNASRRRARAQQPSLDAPLPYSNSAPSYGTATLSAPGAYAGTATRSAPLSPTLSAPLPRDTVFRYGRDEIQPGAVRDTVFRNGRDNIPPSGAQFLSAPAPHVPIIGGQHTLDRGVTGARNVEVGEGIMKQAYDPAYHPQTNTTPAQMGRGMAEGTMRQMWTAALTRNAGDQSAATREFTGTMAKYGVRGDLLISKWAGEANSGGASLSQTEFPQHQGPQGAPLMNPAPAVRPIVDAPIAPGIYGTKYAAPEPTGARTAKLPNGSVVMLNPQGGQVGAPMMQQTPIPTILAPHATPVMGPMQNYNPLPGNDYFIPDDANTARANETRPASDSIPLSGMVAERDAHNIHTPEDQLRKNRYNEGANWAAVGRAKMDQAPVTGREVFDAEKAYGNSVAQIPVRQAEENRRATEAKADRNLEGQMYQADQRFAGEQSRGDAQRDVATSTNQSREKIAQSRAAQPRVGNSGAGVTGQVRPADRVAFYKSLAGERVDDGKGGTRKMTVAEKRQMVIEFFNSGGQATDSPAGQPQAARPRATSQPSVVRSGVLNGHRVHQLADGRVVDEQGNPIQ